jgi:hypothetical protein
MKHEPKPSKPLHAVSFQHLAPNSYRVAVWRVDGDKPSVVAAFDSDSRGIAMSDFETATGDYCTSEKCE